MRSVTEKQPTPMIIFTRDSQPDSIVAAVKAGASTYVVDCNDPERLGSLLAVTKARFDEQQRLKGELQQTKKALYEWVIFDNSTTEKLVQKTWVMVVPIADTAAELFYGR